MISFHDVSFSPAVFDVSFTINAGEKVAIIGRSGSGKTTLLRLLCGWLRPSHGTIKAPTPDAFAYIPQDLDASLNPHMHVQDIILEPIAIARGNLAAAAQQIPALIESLGLPNDTPRRKPSELSGGQRQRVGIARALIANPQVIYADEALSALDTGASQLVTELFSRPELTVLLVTHNLHSAEEFAERFIMLDHGRIVEDTSIERLWNPEGASDARQAFLHAEAFMNSTATNQSALALGGGQ
ncbi:MAG: ATP-binding cassette domain-containing protein [Corynebacterium sp.]|nr:ATP-binding cassette domain-containing protein [Corynebacterium sp.]